METTVKINDLVYIDCFTGLIPAKVTGYSSDGYVTLKVTVTRPGWRLDEGVFYPPASVVPRAHVRVRSGQYRITGSWKFQGLAEKFQPKWASAS